MASNRNRAPTNLSKINLGHVVHLKGAGELANITPQKSGEIVKKLSEYKTIVVDGDPFTKNGFTQILNNESLKNKQLVWFKFFKPKNTDPSKPDPNTERLNTLSNYPNHLKKHYVTLPTNGLSGNNKWRLLGQKAFNAISLMQKKQKPTNGTDKKHDVVMIGGGPTLKAELNSYIMNKHTNSKNTTVHPFIVNSKVVNKTTKKTKYYDPSWMNLLPNLLTKWYPRKI